MLIKPARVGHSFNLSTPAGRGSGIFEFKASLVYTASSRTARAVQGNPISKNKTNKKAKKVLVNFTVNFTN